LLGLRPKPGVRAKPLLGSSGLADCMREEGWRVGGRGRKELGAGGRGRRELGVLGVLGSSGLGDCMREEGWRLGGRGRRE